MDPYLEGVIWGSFHACMIPQIGRQLAPQLRPKYFVEATERFVAVVPEGEQTAVLVGKAQSTYPDVGIVQVSDAPLAAGSVTTADAPIRMVTEYTEPVPVISLEIRERSSRALVTAIEFLSPTNKLGDGRKEYIARRSRFIRMGVNLVEIDLLRSGERVPMVGVFPSVAYAVIVTRADQAPLSDIWPITLRQPLPSIPVPLLRGDPAVPLDLQHAIGQVYDEFSLDLAADYSKPPVVPLSAEDQEWVWECLRRSGRLT